MVMWSGSTCILFEPTGGLRMENGQGVMDSGETTKYRKGFALFLKKNSFSFLRFTLQASHFMFFVSLCFSVLVFSGIAFAQEMDFLDYCQKAMESSGVCPEKVCTLEEESDDPQISICVSKPCDQIDLQNCPQDYCTTMINCRGEKICHFQIFDPPECGNLSYAGQDVSCCEGLLRRCGMAFLDDTCDMHGDDSEYNLPICIPCGDGICTNFENICNCPEDCLSEGDQEYDGQEFNKETVK